MLSVFVPLAALARPQIERRYHVSGSVGEELPLDYEFFGTLQRCAVRGSCWVLDFDPVDWISDARVKDERSFVLVQAEVKLLTVADK